MKRTAFFVMLIVFVVTMLPGCSSSPGEDANTVRTDQRTLELSSPAFSSGEPIPQKHTCDGVDVSPELRVTGLPENVRSLAVLVEDPDAPRGLFGHWILWNVDPGSLPIPEGVSQSESVGSLGGARQGTNGFGTIGYRGPCPPSGSTHRYRFSVYALDSKLDLEPGSQKNELKAAMNDHVIESKSLIGIYQRK